MMQILKARKVGLNCLAFSPDGQSLAASGYRGLLQLWDLTTQTQTLSVKVNSNNCEQVYFQPDGQGLLVLNSYDLHLYQLDGTHKGTRPKGPREPIWAMAASTAHDRVCLYRLGPRESLSQYRLTDFEREWAEPLPDDVNVSMLAYSPDGSRIGVGWGDGAVRVYDTDTGALRQEVVKSGTQAVKAIALAPDSGTIAWCAGPHLHLWRLSPVQEVAHHSIGKTHFLAVAFHPSGDFFATANGDGKIDYWDAHTGAHRQAFDWGVGKLHDVVFDATGDRAACCSKTGEIVIWDVDR